jgi:formamidopyrimidine-DNA glycosylase
MPELPEVETIKNELLPYVMGRTITDVAVFWDKTVRQPSLEEFRSRIKGQKITGLSRRGKYLIFSLSGGEVLVLHLRMTGSLLVKPVSSDPDKFDRAIIYLDGDTALHFRDPRKMGRIWLAADANTVLPELGPEPLSPEFTAEVLRQRLSQRSAPIKAILIDQEFIAGIGNMYADEALFAARIHPLRPANSLSRAEVNRLYRAIQRILCAAIVNKGASVENYYRPSGELGTAHYQFQVAHRLGGERCPVCGTPIERIAVRNRGTYFCPKCQPLMIGKQEKGVKDEHR